MRNPFSKKFLLYVISGNENISKISPFGFTEKLSLFFVPGWENDRL